MLACGSLPLAQFQPIAVGNFLSQVDAEELSRDRAYLNTINLAVRTGVVDEILLKKTWIHVNDKIDHHY